MISALKETSGVSIDEIKLQNYFFKSYEILKRMEYLVKNAFSSFLSIRWKLLKQKPLKSPKNSKNILFLGLLSQKIIPGVIRA